MKSNKRRALIIPACAAIGIPLINAVYSVIPSQAALLLFLVGIILLIAGLAKGKKPEQGRTRELASDIKSAIIETNGRNYIISEGEAFSIDDNGCEGVLSYVEHGIWRISDNSQTVSAPIEITVPKEKTLGYFKAELNRGNVFINSLAANSAAVNVHTGRAEVHMLKAGSLLIDAEAGKAMVEAEISGNITITCAQGTIALLLKNTGEEFNISIQTGGGTVCVGDDIFDARRQMGTIDNNAAKDIKISCGLGNVNIDFRRSGEDEQR